MNYQEALEYIHSTYKFGRKLGLENIKCLLDLMGNPHEGLKFIHIAGTNGKGSTSNYINQILIEEGYKVGLFTSPYLEEFRERIKINNVNIPEDKLARITGYVKKKVEKMISDGKNHPTEFELITAIALEYFKDEEVDYVVFEVGMGGRLDSTNVIESPLVSVITPIDMDHTDYLGDTLREIAFEKAGIIKDNSIVVTHPQQAEAIDVIRKVSKEKNARLFEAEIENIKIKEYSQEGIVFDVKIFDELYENIKISMLGLHQTNNATVALTVIKVLEEFYSIKISRESIYKGLIKSRWPGRLEIIKESPIVLIDGAHNTHGAKALRRAIDSLFKGKRIIGLIGILGDKDYKGMLKEIVPLCTKVIITKPNSPRALDLSILKKEIETFGVEAIPCDSIMEGIKCAFEASMPEDVILSCGSLYLVGEVRKIIKNSYQ